MPPQDVCVKLLGFTNDDYLYFKHKKYTWDFKSARSKVSVMLNERGSKDKEDYYKRNRSPNNFKKYYIDDMYLKRLLIIYNKLKDKYNDDDIKNHIFWGGEISRKNTAFIRAREIIQTTMTINQIMTQIKKN